MPTDRAFPTRLRELLRRAPQPHSQPQPLRVLDDEIRARVLAGYFAETTCKARERIIGLVLAGYHIGPAPYGYRTVRAAGPAAPKGKLRRLVPDPRTAPVVPAIFCLRLDERLSAERIAIELADEPAVFPAPIDSTTGYPRPWTAEIVLAVLRNPVYTGRTVWGRTRNGRRVPRNQWIISSRGAHQALIDDRAFAHAGVTFRSGRGAA